MGPYSLLLLSSYQCHGQASSFLCTPLSCKMRQVIHIHPKILNLRTPLDKTTCSATRKNSRVLNTTKKSSEQSKTVPLCKARLKRKKLQILTALPHLKEQCLQIHKLLHLETQEKPSPIRSKQTQSYYHLSSLHPSKEQQQQKKTNKDM